MALYMKKGLNSFILLMILVLWSNSCLWAQDSQIHDVVERSKTNVVRIEVCNRFGEMETWGSGFFIAQGEILTCAHVVEGAYSLQVWSDFHFYENIVILKVDVCKDLALLCADTSGYEEDYDLKHEDYLNLGRAEEIQLGQTVVTIGYPSVSRRLAFNGTLIESEDDNSLAFQAEDQSYIVIPGMSGGPVLNLKGEVIGVISHVDYGPDIRAIKKFLEKPGDPRELRVAGSVVWWASATFAVFEAIKSTPGVLYDVIIDPIFGRGWLKGVVIILLMGVLIGWGVIIYSRAKRTRRNRKGE